MPGTLLADDWKDTVEQQLKQHATNLFQVVQDAPSNVQRQATQSLEDVRNQLAGYVDQVVQSGPQAAQQPVAPTVQPQAPQPSPLQVLTDYANQVVQSGPQQQPQPAPPAAGAGPTQFGPAQPAAAGAPVTSATPSDVNATDAIAHDTRSGRVFPLPTYRGQVDLHWGDVKGGSDLFAPRGSPIVAMAPGKVVEAGENAVGGNAVLVQGDDGLQYYYAHGDVAPSVQVGQRVEAGTYLMPVGDSGDAKGRGTHLHIGIGPDIRLGADKYGGTGGDYDAVDLLRAALPTNDSTRFTRTTAALSGGGNADNGTLTDRARDLLQAGAAAAAQFGGDAVKALQAVLVTEGGLNGARGDHGASAGPLQFFGEEGGRAGQLNAFARSLGMTLDDARRRAEQFPQEAIAWAIGTPDRPGYLGQAILTGLRNGYSGAQLAEYIQRNGQVSVSPERAAANYNALFGGGGGGAGQEQVAGALTGPRPNADVIQVGDTSRPAPKPPLYMSTMQPAGEEQNPVQRQLQVIQDQVDSLRRSLEPLNQPPLAGVPSAIQQGVADLSGNIGGLLGQVPGVSDFQRGFEAGRQGRYSPEFERRAREIAETPLGEQNIARALLQGGDPYAAGAGGTEVSGKFLSGALQAAQEEQQARLSRPNELEQFGQNVQAFQRGDIGAGLLGSVELGGRVGGPLAGSEVDVSPMVSRGFEAVGVPPEIARVLGQVANLYLPAAGPERTAVAASAQRLRALAREPAFVDVAARWLVREFGPGVVRFLRDERGELNLDGLFSAREEPRPAAPPEPAPTRMFHGTGAAFESPEPGRFAEEGLYGPGYYLTSDPRVAGGVVHGAERVPPAGNVQDAIRQFHETGMPGGGVEPGAVLREGYAQQRAVQEGLAPEQRADLQRRVDTAKQTLAGNPDPALRAYVEQDLADAQAKLDAHVRGMGANVRAVDVPQNLNLFNTDVPIGREAVTRIADAIEPRFGVEAADRLVRVFDQTTNPTGHDVYDILTGGGQAESKKAANEALALAGYDGITYSGGKRVPMADAGGAPIEHQATVIFPESLDKIRNATSGRQRGQAQLPFATNLAGAAFGGYAGNVATPEGASPEERLRNIAVGAAVGAGGTHLALRGGEGRLQPAEAIAGRAPEGFRAPERPGADILRATTQEPPGGPLGPTERPTGPQPRNLGEVHTNPYALREPGPNEAPLSTDEMMAYADELEQRMQDIQSRRDAVDEMIRNPTQKIERPPWAAGYTNDQVAEIARRAGISPYEEAWWDRVGLESGSGEVREDVGQSGLRGTPSRRELSPTELRQERARLDQEAQDVQAAYEQMSTAPAGARLARGRGEAAAADLPFDAGTGVVEHAPTAVEGNGPSGVLADDIVTENGRKPRPSGLKTLWNDTSQVVAEGPGKPTGRGIADAVAAATGEPTEAVRKAMPNLEALLKDAPPEIALQIQKAVEDNPELFAAYNQGRISHASLTDDLARKVGMTTKDWLATPIGKGFSTPELVALQAAAVDAQHGAMDLARDIMARGGVDNLSPEEVAFGLRNLFDAAGVMLVARGGRATQGRSLNALKIRFDRQLARDITGANEVKAARQEAQQARQSRTKAKVLLDQGRDLEVEAQAARNDAREKGASRNILEQIDEAYQQLDRYNAMTLHEKAEVFDRLKKERADRAAARKEKVRSAPEELLSALQAELKAEQKIFAGRKDNWETQAFWDSKAGEIAAEKRRGFRGQLYLEQARRAADIAAKNEGRRAERAWDAASRLESRRAERAKTLLENIGGEAPSRELLDAFTRAAASDDPMVAAKFLKGLTPQRSAFGNVVEGARNANIMRLAGMLSATATHMVNTMGNVVQVPLELGTHAIRTGIDIPRAAITGGERQYHFAEMGPMVRGWLQPDGGALGSLTSLPNILEVLKTGISPSEVADLSTLRPGFRTYLPGRAGAIADPTIEMPLRALQAEDMFFRGRAAGMHAQRVAIREATKEGFRGAQRTGRANNIIANLEDYPELYQEVAESAARMIFQERRTVPGMSNVRLPGTAGEVAGLAVSQVMPFRKTPANITAQGLGLSPFGVAGVLEAVGTRGGIAQRVAAGQIPASRLGKQTALAEDRAARAVIGSALLGIGVYLGTQNDENGRPTHTLTAMYDEDEASTYPQGWRAWSLRTHNPADGSIVYTPLQNFGAAGVPLAMAAIIADAARRGKTVVSDEKEIGRAVAGIGRYALDTPFLQGMSDVVDLLHDPGRAGTKFIEGLASSYGPYSAMGRQVQRAQGVASRNPREGFQMLTDALMADYPGLSGNVPEATTPLGEPRTPGQTGIAAFVSPVRYDVERDNPTLQALRDAGVRVPPDPKTVGVGRGYGVALNEAEQDQLKRARGAAIVAAVDRERANPRVAAWENTLRTTPSDSAAYKDALVRYNGALQATVSSAASAANNQFVKQLGRDQVQARMKPTREVEPTYLGPSGAPVGEPLKELAGG